jgi:alkylated DNA nucleotide flippase Atl1
MIDREEYVEAVLSCVEGVPRGRVTTYGAIAEHVGLRLGGGGPRQVGAVLAAHGGSVPWWRVVRADGSLPPSHQGEARQAYLEEGTPMRTSGRVDVQAALFDLHKLDPRAVDESRRSVEEPATAVDDTPTVEDSPK